LTKLDIKEYIDEQMAEIESSKIADAKEVMEFYTRVLRGEELETVVVGYKNSTAMFVFKSLVFRF